MGLFKYLANYDNKKSIKQVEKIVKLVEDKDAEYSKLSDIELKNKTIELKERLTNGETLDDILPDAFAAVREAAWRVLKMKHFHVHKLFYCQ